MFGITYPSNVLRQLEIYIEFEIIDPLSGRGGEGEGGEGRDGRDGVTTPFYPPTELVVTAGRSNENSVLPVGLEPWREI